MLKKTRTIIAVVVFVLITLLFVDVSGLLHRYLSWLAAIQFWPALLAGHFIAVAALIALTLIFGRIYCSVICPLGIMQDIISHLHGRRKKNRFRYTAEHRWLRYGFLALFIAAFVAGAGSLVALISPYSAYGRIAENLLRPLWGLGNNLLAVIAAHFDSYAFYSTSVWIKSMPTFLIALAMFAIIGTMAWRGGRTWCNTVCPVGTVLGFFSRFAWLKVRIDTTKCNGCGLCARNCKAACIDHKQHKIDYSRCVACGNCMEKCRRKAISYSKAPKAIKVTKALKPTKDPKNLESQQSRRSFIIGAGMLTAAAAFSQEKKKVDGGLAAITDKETPERNTPVTPPGSLSAQNMAKHCTGCQLCVSQCPNEVLRPSTGLLTLMQPTSSFERGYCRPECTRCGEVCPTGAIKPISRADKSAIQVGHAVWVAKNCVPVTDKVECGNCARHCPAGAITMVTPKWGDENAPKVPVVNTARCIGCGACENLCPARPFSAIYVEGHEAHRII